MDLRLESTRTLRLAGPIILGELVQMALHIIDTAMVGALSHKHLAACSLVFGIINIPFVLGIGLTIAIAQMVSLSKGKNDSPMVSHYFFNGMLISILASVLISVVLYWNADIVFHLNQDPEVAVLSKPFLQLMSLSMIPMILFIACKQFADGLEFTKVAMVISLAGVPLNISLNWLLIYGNFGFPRLELNGAAWGTLITRCLMLVSIILYIFNASIFKKYFKIIKRQWYFSWQSCKTILSIGVPTALQIVLEAGAFAVSGIVVGMIGSKEQAAHQIALSIASFTFMVSMGLSQAGSIRISNAYGKQNWMKIQTIGKSLLILALCYGVLCAIFFTIFKDSLPLLFNDNPEVLHIAGTLLVLAAIFQIPDAAQAVSAGALRGLRDVKIPTVYIGLAYWLVGMPLGYYLAFNGGMGAAGIWIGFIISLSLVSVFLALRFFNQRQFKVSKAVKI